MEPMKNLCGLIPESLHKRLMEAKSPEMTIGEYLTKVLTAYLDQPATTKQEQRTLAVQISEDMFQQLKSYLDYHAPLSQKALVQNLLNLSRPVHLAHVFKINAVQPLTEPIVKSLGVLDIFLIVLFADVQVGSVGTY